MTGGRDTGVREALVAMQTVLRGLFPEGLPAKLLQADALANAALAEESQGSYSVHSSDGVHHLKYASDGEESSVGYFDNGYVAQRAAAALNACKVVPTDYLEKLLLWRDAAGGYQCMRRP